MSHVVWIQVVSVDGVSHAAHRACGPRNVHDHVTHGCGEGQVVHDDQRKILLYGRKGSMRGSVVDQL